MPTIRTSSTKVALDNAALSSSSCFDKKIAEELQSKNPSSLRNFYLRVCELMSLYSSGAGNYFYQPIRENIYLKKNTLIGKTAKVEPEEILTQLLMVDQQVDFLFYLKMFFLNIYELILAPIKVLLLLMQEFFFEPKVSISISERRHVREKLNKGVRERVLLFMQTWIDKREKDFIYGKDEVCETLLCFIKYLKESKMLSITFKNRVVKLAQLANHLKDRRKKLKSLSEPSMLINSQKQLMFFHEERANEEANLGEFFKKCSNEDIALTLFVIDGQIFYRNSLYELNPKRINNARERTEAHNDYVYRMNTFVYFYVFLILSQKDTHARIMVFKKLVGLARLLRVGTPMNLEAYQQIKLAFEQPSVMELANCHFLLRQKNLLWGLDKDDLEEYNLLITKSSDNIETICKMLRNIEGPFVPSLRPFVQFIGRGVDKFELYSKDKIGRAFLDLEKLSRYNDVYNLVEKMHHNSATRQCLLNLESHYSKQPLFYFLERGYQSYLSSSLGIDILKIDQFATQVALYRLSQKLQTDGK